MDSNVLRSHHLDYLPIQRCGDKILQFLRYRETETVGMSSETLTSLLGVDFSTYKECGVATSAIQDTVSRLRNQVNSTIESQCADVKGSSKFGFKDSVQDLYSSANNLIQNAVKPDVVNFFQKKN